jgi:hypothetical protein
MAGRSTLAGVAESEEGVREGRWEEEERERRDGGAAVGGWGVEEVEA